MKTNILNVKNLSNYDVISFDFRGHGDSEAKLDQFNVYNQIFDTLCVIKWIKSTVNGQSFFPSAEAFRVLQFHSMIKKAQLAKRQPWGRFDFN